jgi:hypothetical protein
MKIDKTVCLCLNKRWQERRQDILDMQTRIENIGSRFEIFMAQCGDFDPVIDVDIPPIQYYDKTRAELDAEVSQWGYGNAQHKHNHWNALQCHKYILRQAIQEGVQKLFILEDDAYFVNRFESIWEQIQPFIDEIFIPILYLGWWVGDENDEFNKNIETNWHENGTISIVKVRQVGGLHAAIIDCSMFDFLINLPDNNPIDAQLNLLGIHHQINTIFIAPKLIHTRSTYSYCEGNVIERNNI